MPDENPKTNTFETSSRGNQKQKLFNLYFLTLCFSYFKHICEEIGLGYLNNPPPH